MDSDEQKAILAYKAAYATWEAEPTAVHAKAVYTAASALVAISDDYQEKLDEAADLVDVHN